jgi:ribose 5-phosphate isomerase RpiB
MRIAVINEVSTAGRNIDIMAALQGRGHDIINLGMKTVGQVPELTLIHSGFISALLLNSGRVDYIVAGCSTGQGYRLSVGQYPNMFCGHVETPLDAWLFPQINGGNCVSLGLNQGYGWGADVNLGIIFDQLFAVSYGTGYPPHRRAPQEDVRLLLERVSQVCHRTMAEIVLNLEERVVKPALSFPGVWEFLDVASMEDRALADALCARHEAGADVAGGTT